MYNKKILPILCIAFSFTANVFAQKTIVESDTTMNVKLIKEDKNLIFPTLKSPQQFCFQLRAAWNDYLKSHTEVVKDFDFNRDSANYYSSITLDILLNGKVSNTIQKKWYSNLDSICNEVFKPVLRKSIWTATYRKYAKTRKYINTTVKVYFTITKTGLQKITLDDLKTGQTFFKCF